MAAGAAAATLSPDKLDAPAATSVIDAQRSAAMASDMAGGGGHGGHGATGTYRHVDAGRGPEAFKSPQGGGDMHEGHGDHGSEAEPTDDDGDRQAIFVCPMHPDVRTAEPGTCPICGMELERRPE